MHKKLPKLDLNITNRCNFRCVHCAFDSGITRMNELKLNDLEGILRETKELGGEKIDITGGEPTLRGDFEDVIEIGKSFGYKIELVTNGSLLTKGKLVRLKKLDLDSIAISLDGSTYEVYRKIRKVNEKTYKRVLQTIKDAVKLGFYTKVNTVVFESNLEDLPRIAELCIRLGVKENGIYYFTPVGRGCGSKELTVEPIKWLNFIRKNLTKYDSKIKMSVEVPLIEKGFEKEVGCILKSDPYHLQIMPTSEVYPCAILASYKKPIGNLHETGIKEVWNNKKLWMDYNKKTTSSVFNKYNGYCADFSSFKTEKYKKIYKFVCPLRKFRARDLKWEGT